MCADCEWEEFVRACDVRSPTSASYRTDATATPEWEEKVDGMRSWAEEHEHSTETMWDALERISEGAAKWLD